MQPLQSKKLALNILANFSSIKVLFADRQRVFQLLMVGGLQIDIQKEHFISVTIDKVKYEPYPIEFQPPEFVQSECRYQSLLEKVQPE